MTQSTLLRTNLGDVYAALDTIELLDGATIVATVTLSMSNSSGVVTADPAAVVESNPGTVDGARMYDASAPTAELTGLTVSTIAAGTGQVQLSSLAIADGESVDLAVTLTVPAS